VSPEEPTGKRGLRSAVKALKNAARKGGTGRGEGRKTAT